METEVAKDNALAGNMGYVFNSAVQGFCKQTARVASTDSKMIQENNEINGYKVLVSEQCAAYTAYFGNFADLIFGIWGNGVDVNIDKSTGSKAGTVRIVALLDADVGLRRAQSFCKANNAGS
jgi:hypothetical protein